MQAISKPLLATLALHATALGAPAARLGPVFRLAAPHAAVRTGRIWLFLVVLIAKVLHQHVRFDSPNYK